MAELIMYWTRIASLFLTLLTLLTGCGGKAPPSVLPAVTKADPKAVQAAVKKGADVNAKDSKGFTALMIAAEKGLTPIVQVLLDKGADANDKEPKQGRTALMLAAGNGHLETVQALLAKGADVQEKDVNGRTALIIAADKGLTPMVQL